MKHILYKRKFSGSGGGKKGRAAVPKPPPPPTLKPPKPGLFSHSSYAVGEIVDLICDGPIEGLVNSYGLTASNQAGLLQAIYLDNTPIETSTKRVQIAENEKLYSFNLSSQLTKFGSVFYDPGTNVVTKYSPLIRNVDLNIKESAILISRYIKFHVYYKPIRNRGFLGIGGSDVGLKVWISENTQFYPFGAIDGRLEIGKQNDENPYGSSNVYYTNDRNHVYSRLTDNYTNQYDGALRGWGAVWSWRFYTLRDQDLNFSPGSDPINNSLVVSEDNLVAALSKFLNFIENPKNNTIPFFVHESNDLEVHLAAQSMKDPNSLVNTYETLFNDTLSSPAVSDHEKTFVTEAKEKLNNFKLSNFNILGRTKSKTGAWLLIKMGTRSSPITFEAPNQNTKSIFQSDGVTIDPVSFVVENASPEFEYEDMINCLVPIIQNNQYTGQFYGMIAFKIKTRALYNADNIDINAENPYESTRNFRARAEYTRFKIGNLNNFTSSRIKVTFKRGNENLASLGLSKYNFTNVAAEFRNGTEFQRPLDHFKNIYVDYDYNQELLGPFIPGVRTTAGGSDDVRDDAEYQYVSYSDWGGPSHFYESASPIVHVIENPNVTSIAFSILIKALSDTAHKTFGRNEVGEKLNSSVVFTASWGKIIDGQFIESGSKTYKITGVVEGSAIIDFGMPEYYLNLSASTHLDGVYDLSINGNDVQARPFEPYVLPSLLGGEKPSDTKRYIKITKLTAETNSVLIQREIGVGKITEIIPNTLSYPFSALVGIKLDARTIGDLPERSYDCRLKRIQIPSNYFPINSFTSEDNRYITRASEYLIKNEVYIGDWDGTFKEGWTDNPAWILYDILTSNRYGLGGYIDESQINIWDLYKIGRFCDAVDDEGYFIGVDDGVGGLEPRYSCNILLKEQSKVFDTINLIANLFRGVVYFANSEINFLDDRPRNPIAIFTNANTKDGLFNYFNNRRDQQFNSVEVVFLDRFDNFQVKTEYISDEEDIRKRGIFKTRIVTQGVTSRAMARRIGQHVIYQTLKENQGVEFNAGLETLLCRPGDLIIIEDEMKTRSTNYGHILEIDLNEKKVFVENFYEDENFNGKLMVYTPTGYTTKEELDAISAIKRKRLPFFEITGNLINNDDSILTGKYNFSGYSAGYTGSNQIQMYPVYTGKHASGHNVFIYYNTGVSGFVFSTGKAFQDNNTFDKVISMTGIDGIEEIVSATGLDNLKIFGSGFRYDQSAQNKRSSSVSGSIFNKMKIDSDPFKGILESEISTVNHPQITTFNVTGYENLSFGCRLFIDENDININLLQFINQGSPYRIERKNAEDQIYKVLSIREINQNEYNVVATKYNTGKFEEIEKFKVEDYLPETFYSGPPIINNIQINQLPAPKIISFTTGQATSTGFTLTGNWQKVTNAQYYDVEVYNELTNTYLSLRVDGDITGESFDDLNTLGHWKFRIKSIGNNSTFIDSPYSRTGIFVAYLNIDSAPYSRPFISNFSII